MVTRVEAFSSWTRDRSVGSLGTNSGSLALPFQKWRRFKEAFAPELVARALASAPTPVEHCIDPFGGSGTTALACQFHGVVSSTLEVNPYLADLIAAKTVAYDCEHLAYDLGQTLRNARLVDPDFEHFRASLPPTFVEPGKNGRWLFSEEAARRILALQAAIELLSTPSHQRLFRVLLGGVLIELSNVITSGKGRRYRRSERMASAGDVDAAFTTTVQSAVREIYAFRHRPTVKTTVTRVDARVGLSKLSSADLAVFSPPYCNSFDYTDVYNVELWMLQYLKKSADNSTLRASTLCSHVQHSRDFPAPPPGSPTLRKALMALHSVRDDLWDKRLPQMVGGYFADIAVILDGLYQKLRPTSTAWIVVADSRYADTRIETANIINELAPTFGFEAAKPEGFRAIRTSAQQGGQFELGETLIVLRRT